MPEIAPGDPKLKQLSGLHLWHAPMSSCSQRVRIALVETGQAYESHPVNLEQNEHASAEYQAIHPKGLVPALVDDGRLFIESVDIIQHVSENMPALGEAASSELLQMADAAQADLKLLTFEFLFRANPPPPEEKAAAFEDAHQNEWLKQFRRDFAAGFDRDRIYDAVARTDAGFRHLDDLLSDGRPYLAGETFSLSDIAWMPNAHRFSLMGWPFDRTPHLAQWFDRIAERPSYQKAVLDMQNPAASDKFATYTRQRQAEGTDIASVIAQHIDKPAAG